MSYTTSDILAQLNLSEDSSLYDLINKLNTYNLVTNDELANIINISVKPLPNIVRNQADVLKQKMYGIATNEEFGLPVVINRRIVLLQYISKRLIEYTERTDNPHNVTASQVGSYSKEEMDTILQELEEQLREEINNVKSELQQKIDNLQNQINTLSGNVGDINIGDLNSRLTKVEKLLDSDDVDLDTLQEVINVLKGNELGVNKSLYNLGAYDTISGNTITRKTGYITINAENITGSQSTTNSNGFYPIYTNLLTPSNILVNWDNQIGVSNSEFSVKNINSSWIKNGEIGLYATDTIIIGIDNSTHTIDSVKEMCPIYIQYELANSYTENVIEGQPLITLDQNGSNWLREEWEKGLNLCNFINGNHSGNDRTLFVSDTQWSLSGTDSSSHLWIPFKETLPIGVYTFNCIFEGSSETTRFELYTYKTKKDYDYRHNIMAGSFGSFTRTIDCYNEVNGLFLLYSGSINGTLKFMITKGNGRYPYVPYNQSKHINNYEANFLKEENLKSANKFSGTWLSKTNIEGDGSSSYNACLEYISVEPNTTYSVYHEGSFNSRQIYLYDNSKNLISDNDYSTSAIVNKTITFTTPSNCYYVRFTTWTSDNTDLPSNTMLNKGTTALPYQPYNSSKHITNQEANLLKEEWENQLNLATDVLINTTVSSTGEYYSAQSFYCSTHIEVEVGKTYSFEGNTYCTYDKNKNFVSMPYWTETNSIHHYTIPSGVKYIIISKNGDSNIMLNEGSVLYDYQPYNASKHITNYEAKFLKEEFEKSSNLAVFYNRLDEYNSNNNWKLRVYCYLKPNTTYTMRCNQSTSVESCYLKLDNTDVQTISTNYAHGLNFTFTTSSDVSENTLYNLYFNLGNEITDTDLKIMLNKGTTPLPYQEYQGQIVHQKDINSLVSFNRSLTSGTQVGVLNINGTTTTLYAPTKTNVINSLTSTSTTDALSAYQGKALNDKIPKLYEFNVFCGGTDEPGGFLTFKIIASNPSYLSTGALGTTYFQTLATTLYNAGHTSSITCISASGSVRDENVIGVYAPSTTEIGIVINYNIYDYEYHTYGAFENIYINRKQIC